MYHIDEIQLEDQPTLVMRNRLFIQEMPPWFSTAYGKVAGVIGATGAKMTGPPFASYVPVDGEPGRFDIEAGFAVDEAIPGEGEVVASTLPGGQVAHTWHTGPYEKLTNAYQELMAWIAERDMEPADKAWEIYQSDPSVEPDPANWRTEVFMPFRCC